MDNFKEVAKSIQVPLDVQVLQPLDSTCFCEMKK